MGNDSSIAREHKVRNGRRFVRTRDGLWVRDPLQHAHQFDEENRDLVRRDEVAAMLRNETDLAAMNLPMMQSLGRDVDRVLIVGDGHGFDRHVSALSHVPQGVAIITINRALRRWPHVCEDLAEEHRIPIAAHVHCDPLSSTAQLPVTHWYWPPLICASRSHPSVARAWQSAGGGVSVYCNTGTPLYAGGPLARRAPRFHHDYRSPLCAAISLAAASGVCKLALLCCDAHVDEPMPGTVAVDTHVGRLHSYPQPMVSWRSAEAMLRWLRLGGIEVCCSGSSPKSEDLPYLRPESLIEFLESKSLQRRLQFEGPQ